MKFLKEKKQVYRFGTVMTMVLAIALIGCRSAGTPPGDIDTSDIAPPSEMRLAAGDVIEIKFPYAGQFNERLTIMPNGKITLPLVGEVTAAGKTPVQLQEELINLHAKHLQHPDLAVIVRSFFGNRVFVGGEVLLPGYIELPGQLSVLQAITQAGGFNMDAAEVKNVVVIRMADNQRKSYVLDFEKTLEGESDKPFYLQPRDIVHVPRTTIVNVGQWINQHIYDLLPVGRVGYNLN